MTSIYKPLIKIISISLIITAGIGLSVFSSIKQSQASPSSNLTEVKQTANKQQTFPPKSYYERNLQWDIKKLIPGNKQFSPAFLRHVLTSNQQQEEV